MRCVYVSARTSSLMLASEASEFLMLVRTSALTFAVSAARMCFFRSDGDIDTAFLATSIWKSNLRKMNLKWKRKIDGKRTLACDLCVTDLKRALAVEYARSLRLLLHLLGVLLRRADLEKRLDLVFVDLGRDRRLH